MMWIYRLLSVLTILLFSCAYGFEESFNSDAETISTLGLSITDLGDQSALIEIDEFPLRLFPELQFTNNESNGEVFCFRSILRGVCEDDAKSFEFQVWRLSNDSFSYEKVFTFELLKCDSNANQLMVCACQYRAQDDIRRGDVLGILHDTTLTESNLLYKINSGHQVLFGRGNETNIELSASSALNEYPLVAMESDSIQGLLSHRMLEDLVLNVERSNPYQGINVMCSGTIQSWYIGGLFLNLRGTVLTLNHNNICEAEFCDPINTVVVNFNDIECIDRPNVYKIATPDSQWMLKPGDTLNILFNESNFLLHQTGKEIIGLCGDDTTTKIDIPLLSIEFSEFDSTCNDDILSTDDVIYDLDTLANRALLIQNAKFQDNNDFGYVYILPSTFLTKASLIHQWRFAAKEIAAKEIAPDEEFYPSFQVWRKRDDVFVLVSRTNTREAPSTMLGALNIHYYNIADFVYQPGDAVVVYQPPSSRLAVAFINASNLYEPTHVVLVQEYPSSLSTFVNTDQIQSNLQNINLLINLDLTEDDSTPTLVNPTSSSPFSTIVLTEARNDELIFIATGVVGGIIIILTLIIFVFILIICIRYKKNRKSYNTSDTKGHEVGEEAIYAVIEPKSKFEDAPSNVNVIYHTIGPVNAYEQPDGRALSSRSPIAYETPRIKRKALPKKELHEITNHYNILEEPSPPPMVLPSTVLAKQSNELTASLPPIILPATILSKQSNKVTAPLPPIILPATVLAKQSNELTGDGNGHIYQVLEKPPVQVEAVKEIKAVESFYVPTQKERSNLTNSNDVYRSLRENQVASPTSDTAFFEESNEFWAPESDTSKLYEQLAKRKYREIPRSAIQRNARMGSGEFGNVYKGLWKRLDELGEVEIAIKMLKKDVSEREKVRFLQEGAINGQFQHPNIVKLLGMVTVGNPIMIIQELLPKGDLGAYLNNHRSKLSRKDPSLKWPRLLLQFCQDTAAGMTYLSKKGFVHRDLAARNILLTEKLNCKVTDFGMSRDLEEGNHYISRGGLIPVRWTAPEALSYSMYSTASDVWSFGVVMHEIWSFGSKPYAKYKNPKVVKLVEGGHRLNPPPGCPKEVYLMMMKCWHPDSSFRPSFDGLLHELIELEKKLLLPQETTGEQEDRFTDLGRSLEHGKDLYTELQRIYLTENQQIA